MICCRHLLFAALLSASPASAAGNVTLTDQNNAYVGTVTNPLVVIGGTGSTGGGAVYGTDATGAAPTKAPLFIAGIDNSGNIKPFPLTANGLKVDGSAVTQPVSATALPLPSGAATAANQTTTNSSLATIATNTTNAATVAGQVRNAYFIDATNFALAASGTFSGAVHSFGTNLTRVNASLTASQAGTATLQGCDNAGCTGNSFPIATQTLTGGTSYSFNGVSSQQYVYLKVQNTNSTAGFVYANVSLTAN